MNFQDGTPQHFRHPLVQCFHFASTHRPTFTCHFCPTFTNALKQNQNKKEKKKSSVLTGTAHSHFIAQLWIVISKE